VSEEQLEGLLRIRKAGVLKGTIPVIAQHHHFSDFRPDSGLPTWWSKIEAKTMQLRDRRKVLKLLDSLEARYVLHGHIHRNELYKRNDITVLNGAGAVCDDCIEFLKFNELLFTDGSVQVRMNVLPIPYQSSSSSLRRHRLRFALPTAPCPVPASKLA
jgi:hypothetical protein